MDHPDRPHDTRLTRRDFARLTAAAVATGLLPRAAAAQASHPYSSALPSLGFDHRSWLVDGKSAYLMSGEFHYFRVPKADWKRRMQLFKNAGGTCLATYIPWLLHEPVEGRFEFGGEVLDFEGFCETAHAMGLHVVARPGPYQYTARGRSFWRAPSPWTSSPGGSETADENDAR